ncbi:MAG: hypothetical protein KDK71_07800, partial [Chlamydiia bacterium]|nr:hypothetical protein [Chlamydiia bacterium]
MIVKSFITALQEPIQAEELQAVAKILFASAQKTSKHKKIRIEKTSEYTDFPKITSKKLHEKLSVQEAREGASFINDDPMRKLKLEGEMIVFYASYFPFRISLRAQGRYRHLKSTRFMSGTPWNYWGYRPDLITEDNLILDRAATGSILQVLLNRKNDIPTYLPQEATLEGAFEAIYQEKEERFAQGIFDAAAQFCQYKNLAVARAFMAFAKDKGLPFEGVLFFDSSSDQKGSGQFSALMENGDVIPIKSGTRAKDVEQATQKPMEAFFVYLGQENTTGTDLELPPKFQAVWTGDQTILMRTILQTLLRERDYFLEQDGAPLIPLAVLPHLARKQESPIDKLLAVAEINQGVASSDSLDRTFYNRVDQVFQDCFHDLAETKPLDQLALFCTLLSSLVQHETKDDPHNQFSGIDTEENYLEVFKLYVDAKIDRLDESLRVIQTQKSGDSSLPELAEICAKIKEELKQIKQEAESVLHRLPATKPTSGKIRDPIGTEVYQERQVDQEVEIDHIEEVLRQELLTYETIAHGPLREENLLSDEEMISFIEAIRKGKKGELKSLNEAFQAVQEYRQNYAFWSDALLVTENFRLLCEDPLPVFQPMQRPAKQILRIRTEEKQERLVFLSVKEGVHFADFLNRHYESNKDLLEHVHLFHPNRKVMEKNPHHPLPIEKPFMELVVQVNLFNGNLRLIDSNLYSIAKKWMNGDSVNEKESYIKLRVERNELERTVLYSSDLLKKNRGISAKIPLCQLRHKKSLFDPRLIPLMTNPDDILELTEDDLEYIIPTQVPHLDKGLIPFLGKKELIHAVTDLDFLSENQIPLISDQQIYDCPLDKVPFLEFHQLNDMDLANLANKQDFVDALSTKQIKGLRNPAFIPCIKDVNLKYLDNELVPSIPKERYTNNLSTQQLEAVPLENYSALTYKELDSLSPAKIRAIRDKSILIRIQEKINAIDPKVVHLLDKPQLKHLTQKELIEKVPLDDVDELIDTQYEHLTTAQAERLSAEAVQKNTNPKLLPKLLSETQAEHVPQDVLDKLDKATTQALQSPSLISRLKEQTQHLTQKQLVSATEKQFESYMSDQQVKEMTSPALIKRLPKKFFPLLTQDQAQELSETQEKEIEFTCILPLLSETQGRHVPQKVLDKLDSETTKALKAPSLIRRLKGQTKHLTQEQLVSASDEQFESHISDQQVKEMINPALIKRL